MSWLPGHNPGSTAKRAVSLALRLLLAVVFLAGLAGCASLTGEGGEPVASPIAVQPDEGQPLPSETPLPLAATETPLTPEPQTLRIWLPPQFDPAADTRAASLLRQRLDDFTKRRVGVQVEVRIKAVEGPGGLLDSLSSASAAAPNSLPDLVALPSNMLEAAALKGLLHPYDRLTRSLDDPDWYEYARQLARLQNSLFGMPFAGDALVLVHRTELTGTLPVAWNAFPQGMRPLVFPAASPQALTTLALYLGRGGALVDDQGRPTLDATVLGSVLTSYQQGVTAQIIPVEAAQLVSDDQSWALFQNGQAGSAITWASEYLSSELTGTLMAPLPMPGEKAFTLASGWVWAIASPHVEQHLLAAQLAEFLTESAFLSDWTEALGMLPVRPSGIEAQRDVVLKGIISQVALSAQALPSADILTGVGGPVQKAVVQVIGGQSLPDEAAEEAARELEGP